jgi:FlaA1/EpsC-like NDP-sugar epimerase
MLKEENLSRYFVAIFSIVTFIFMGLEKFLLRNLLNVLREKGRNLRNLLIVGAVFAAEGGDCENVCVDKRTSGETVRREVGDQRSV